jgi:hypothetical protein
VKAVTGYQAKYISFGTHQQRRIFCFFKKNFRSFHCWIKDFRRTKTRKLMHVCRIIPKSTLLRSMNNARTRRSHVFYFKFAYGYLSSYVSPVYPYFIAADTVDWARKLLKLLLLSFVESHLDFINGSDTKQNTVVACCNV